jgi:hypothetical protein
MFAYTIHDRHTDIAARTIRKPKPFDARGREKKRGRDILLTAKKFLQELKNFYSLIPMWPKIN